MEDGIFVFCPSSFVRYGIIMSGHVFQISVSDGGVPKLAVPAGDVTELGFVNDKQNNTRHHGGPQRAVCLFPLEHILALQAEGHAIYPGSIGENITLAGIDWAGMVPGARLTLGDEVTLEVTSYAAPCKKIRASFAEEDFSRVSQKKYAGWARAYVKVISPGRVQVGDKVTVSNIA